MLIHPTAVIDKTVEIDNDVVIDSYVVIKGDVKIKKGTKISSHAVIEGPTEIGENNNIFQFASIGTPPQDLKYAGEPTKLVIGNNNIFREFVTINRGTVNGRGCTEIGNNNFFMAYCHVAHDCIVKNNVILANNATLAGHIFVDDNAIIGGLSAVHQFSRIGKYSMIAGKTGVVKDIPPYMLASGARAKLFGPNVVGLERNGFSKQRIDVIKKLYHILFKKKYKFSDAIEIAKRDFYNSDDAKEIINFILGESKRGITLG
jgi:UDP-N-acetylglucosamine acyltransferase